MFYVYINFHLHLHGDAVKGGTYNISKNIKIKFVEQSKIALFRTSKLIYLVCLTRGSWHHCWQLQVRSDKDRAVFAYFKIVASFSFFFYFLSFSHSSFLHVVMKCSILLVVLHLKMLDEIVYPKRS